MKNKKDIYAFSFCIVLALVIIGVSLGMEEWESKIFPMILSFMIIVLAAIGLISTIRISEKSSSPGGGFESGKVLRKSWSSGYAAVYTLFFGYFITIYGLGFMIATPLFVLAYTKMRGMKWSASIGFCAALTVFQYVIFLSAMKIHLYPGLLFE